MTHWSSGASILSSHIVRPLHPFCHGTLSVRCVRLVRAYILEQMETKPPKLTERIPSLQLVSKTSKRVLSLMARMMKASWVNSFSSFEYWKRSVFRTWIGNQDLFRERGGFQLPSLVWTTTKACRKKGYHCEGVDRRGTGDGKRFQLERLQMLEKWEKSISAKSKVLKGGVDTEFWVLSEAWRSEARRVRLSFWWNNIL